MKDQWTSYTEDFILNDSFLLLVHNLSYCSPATEIDAKLGVGMELGFTVTVGLVVW